MADTWLVVSNYLTIKKAAKLFYFQETDEGEKSYRQVLHPLLDLEYGRFFLTEGAIADAIGIQ
jgi:hypothetical protein